MFHLSRFQLGLIFVSLLLLRVVVGFHFFKEGTAKLKSGNFTAQYFFAEAKGPLAPFFKKLLNDPDGKILLCVSEAENSENPSVDAKSPNIDPTLTYLIWDDFLDQATNYFGFGSADLIAEISKRRTGLEQAILSANQRNDVTAFARLESELATDERNIRAIADQPARANQIFLNHKVLLADFLDQNRSALVSHFASTNRLQGSDKDGDRREQVATYVDSLRDQVTTIEQDRKKQLQAWKQEVLSIWDSLEQQINALALDAQAEKNNLRLHRPFDQENSALKLINRVIPWFDTVLGIMLILGLFSRLAIAAAAGFLISVIATQPPLFPGSLPTYFYFIELAACLVIFSTAAGRFGGLDFFLSRRPTALTPAAEASQL